MSAKDATAPFQALIDNAVAQGVAPGFQCVVFTRDDFVFNGVSGLASVPSADFPSGRPFTPSSLLWTASCTKLTMCLIVLHILDRGLAKNGFSLADMDSHEALVEILPEFRHGSGSLVTKIIEGFEDKLGTDGKKVMKLRDAKGKVTLRMLFTHTSGCGFPWNNPLLYELYKPSDGSIPHNLMAGASGNIRDFAVPLVLEPGTDYHYGFSTDWLGQFAIRATNKTLRELYKEIIFEPLGIPSTEADIWLSPELIKSRADLHRRNPGSDSGFVHTTNVVYSAEHAPAEGKAYGAQSGLYTSSQSYARVLQAIIREDPRIMSSNLWKISCGDALKGSGIKIPRPEWRTTMPELTPDIDEFSKSTKENGVSINLLQCKVATAPTLSGRPIGSFAWGGLPNIYYFVDPINGVGAVIGAQLLPLHDEKVIEVRDKLEVLVYEMFSPAV